MNVIGWLRPVALVGVGAAVGAIVAVALGRQEIPSALGSANDEAGARRLTSAPLTASSLAHARWERLADLDARLRALETDRQAPSGSPELSDKAAQDRQEPFAPRVVRTAEENRALVREVLAEHAAQRVDSAWASTTTELIEDDLTMLAGRHAFQVLGAECRSTSCLAKVEWETSANAVEAYRNLAHHVYRANCANTIILDEEPGSSGSIGGTLLFDCESWRAGGEVVTAR